jgi:hypothetical protein
MANGKLIEELRELEKGVELPAKVTNRLILTAIIQLYERVEENNKIKSKVGRLEGVVALLSTMWLAVVGWMIFGG